MFYWSSLILALCVGMTSQGLAVYEGSGLGGGCLESGEAVREVKSVSSKQISGSGTYSISLEREHSQDELQSPFIGAAVEVVRCLPPGQMVQIAKGKIEKINGAFYVASVFVPGKVAAMDTSVAMRSLVTRRNLYWQPMAGDKVRVLTPEVVRTQRVWPRFEFDVAEIFETKSGDDVNYLSLSETGRRALVEAFEQIENYRGRFLVESNSSEAGDLSHIQEITQMRAGAIANYLSRVFEMEPTRIIARGNGRIRSNSLFIPSSQNMYRVGQASGKSPARALNSESVTQTNLVTVRILKE